MCLKHHKHLDVLAHLLQRLKFLTKQLMWELFRRLCKSLSRFNSCWSYWCTRLACLCYSESYLVIFYSNCEGPESVLLLMVNFISWVSDRVLAWVMSKAEVRKELQRIHDIFVVIMAQDLKGICRGKVIIGLGWLKRLLTFNCRGVFIRSRDRRLKTTIHWSSSASFIAIHS